MFLTVYSLLFPLIGCTKHSKTTSIQGKNTLAISLIMILILKSYRRSNISTVVKKRHLYCRLNCSEKGVEHFSPMFQECNMQKPFVRVPSNTIAKCVKTVLDVIIQHALGHHRKQKVSPASEFCLVCEVMMKSRHRAGERCVTKYGCCPPSPVGPGC